MNKLLLITVLAAGLSASAQTFNETKQVAVTAEVVETIGEEYKVRSREMTIDESNKTIEYKGDVVFITDMITLEADKIEFDHNTKQVVATGNFRSKGVAMKFTTGTKPTVLRYTLGDDVAYLE
jgi:lipopolysaccharide assembly outer membrane protein LptD (OstA)